MTASQAGRLRALRAAKNAMDRGWAEPGLDLEAVAAHVGYSPCHFVRVYKAVYGETPGRYLSRRRIEEAEQLLRRADLSVTEVCARVGFSSLGTFSTRFKQRTGMSPTTYRARHSAHPVPGPSRRAASAGRPPARGGCPAEPGRGGTGGPRDRRAARHRRRHPAGGE